MRSRLLAAAAIAALCWYSVVRVTHPPAAVPATAADTVFSAERAMTHVRAIATAPHALGMPDHDRVRDYLVAQLTALGLHPQIQRATAIATRHREAGRIQNVVAWLPGTDTGHRAVLVVAHYDGVAAGPAAADDGAGCAALLETLRALRASKTVLRHDVIALFTDGEEAGLLGAAAFVREHPWANDVDVVLNFEARGTNGRSLMFETGAGNLDAARVLRAAPDVTTGSVFVVVYRALPNDTDLSELSALGTPALNFAFTGDVDRYHTSRDDASDLDPRSLQHHGSQMLALARAFGDGPLPRPRTGDGVFFDFPMLGVVVYPVWFAAPVALLALVLVALVLRRDARDDPRLLRGTAAGAVATLLALVISLIVARVAVTALVTLHQHLPWRGAPDWSGTYAVALALITAAIVVWLLREATRWGTLRALHDGVLVVWLVVAVAATAAAPAASYPFVWPLVAVAAARLVPYRAGLAARILRWIAAAIAIILGFGVSFATAAVLLGLSSPWSAALIATVALTSALLLPVVAPIEMDRANRAPRVLAVAAIAVTLLGVFTVRRSADHPVRSALIYAENADSAGAWLLASSGQASDAWTRAVLPATTRAPAWTARLLGGYATFVGRRVARLPLDAPAAVLARDTVIKGARRVVLRVTAPPGTTELALFAHGAPVLTASIDGRVIDTTRYRGRAAGWPMGYWAVPDSGAIVALSIPLGASIDVELAARRPGLPAVPGVAIPPRPADVVPSQTGDATVVYRHLRV
jgi:hypothetical protein